MPYNNLQSRAVHQPHPVNYGKGYGGKIQQSPNYVPNIPTRAKVSVDYPRMAGIFTGTNMPTRTSRAISARRGR